MASYLRATASLLILLVGACSEPEPFDQDLEEGPQILAGGTGSSVLFPLTPAGETSVRDVALLNVGQDLLLIRPTLRIEGRNPGQFALVDEITAGIEVRPREAYGIRVNFSPTSRRVALAELVVESNAGNFPELRVELIGLGGTNPLTDGPDIAGVISPVEIPIREDGTTGSAVVRYANLGIGTLIVTGYLLTDTTSFAFAPGTPVPGAACATDGVCEPEGDEPQGCCELTCEGICDGGAWDGLECTAPCPGASAADPEVACLDPTCTPLTVGGGEVVGVPVGVAPGASVSGSYDISVRIYSNDPDVPDQQIRVAGTL